MKNLFFLIFSFTTFFCYSQDEAYFVDKKGKKTIIREDAIEVIGIDKRISYKLPGKTWEKYITFKDLDSLIFGDYYFKSFKIDKKDRAFFVLAEEGNRKLAGISYEVSTTSSSGRTSVHYYDYMYVIENDNTIIEDFFITDFRNKKNVEKRKSIPTLIKNYFPNCTDLLDRIDEITSDDSDEEKYLNILELVQNPIYIKCN